MARLVPLDEETPQKYWNADAIRGRLVETDDKPKRTAGQNIAGGAGEGIISTLALPAELFAQATGMGFSPTQDLKQFYGQQGIPTEYDDGSYLGRASSFASGSLLLGGAGRIRDAKAAIQAGAAPVRAYAGQFGRELGQSAAAAGSSLAMERGTEGMEDGPLKAALNFASPMLPQMGLLGLTGATRVGMRGLDNEGLGQRASAFKAATGADPMVQQVAGNDRMMLAERGLNFTGAGALPIAAQAQKQVPQFQSKVAGIAGGGETRATAAGEIAQRGLFGPTGYVTRRAGEVGQLYDNLFNLMPKDYRLPLSSTKQTLDKFLTRYANDPEFKPILDDPAFKELREAIAANESRVVAQSLGTGPTVETVRALRTDIGKMIGNRSVIPSDKAIGELKGVYGALSDDLKQAAVALDGGTPGAVSGAFDAADSAWKDYRANVDNFLRPLEGKDIDRMYDIIRNGSADQANAVLGSLTRAERNAFTEVVINRMGLTRRKQGDVEFEEYTPNAFLRNWKDLPARMQEALVPNVTARAQLSSMAREFDKMLQGGKLVFNTSGTTGSGMLASQIVAFISGLGTGGVGMVTGNVPAMAGGFGLAATSASTLGLSHWAARKIADPKLVNWLAKANKIPVVAMPGHIARLGQIDFGTPEDNAMRDQLVGALSQRFGGE